jgi:OOP family OmpA-OmpF porin
MRSRSLFLALAAATCSTALADVPARGWFVGVDVGNTQLDGEMYYAGGDPFSFNENSTSFTLHGGYRFSRAVSLGIGYSDFGDFSANGSGARLEAAFKGYTVNFVVRLPLNERLGLLGTVAAMVREMDLTATQAGQAPLSETGTLVTGRLGIGLSYQLNDDLDLRLDVAQTRDVGESYDGPETPSFDFTGDLTSVTAGIRYKF